MNLKTGNVTSPQTGKISTKEERAARREARNLEIGTVDDQITKERLAKREENRTKLNTLTKEVENLKKRLNEREVEINELTSTIIPNYEKTILDLKKEIGERDIDIEDQKNIINDRESSIASLNARLNLLSSPQQKLDENKAEILGLTLKLKLAEEVKQKAEEANKESLKKIKGKDRMINEKDVVIVDQRNASKKVAADQKNKIANLKSAHAFALKKLTVIGLALWGASTPGLLAYCNPEIILSHSQIVLPAIVSAVGPEVYAVLLAATAGLVGSIVAISATFALYYTTSALCHALSTMARKVYNEGPIKSFKDAKEATSNLAFDAVKMISGIYKKNAHLLKLCVAGGLSLALIGALVYYNLELLATIPSMATELWEKHGVALISTITGNGPALV